MPAAPTFRIVLFALTLAGCAASRRAPAPAAVSGEKQYAIVLSMDAFRRDLADRAHTPTLDSLRVAGTYAEIYPVYPSNTFPSHYAMATGLHPDRHGVVNNTFYDREAGLMRSVFDSADVRTPGFWGGEPIWNTAERQGLRAEIYMWPGSDIAIGGRRPSRWMPYSSKPSYYERADWIVGAMTRPEADIPRLVMWYFDQPDTDGHSYGPESEEVAARVEHIDSVLGYFFREIRRSPVYDRIHFILTSDHGMASLSPERYLNLYPLLDTAQVVRVVPGTPFGIEVREPYVREALRRLRRAGHLRAWRSTRMPCRFHYGRNTQRITNIVVVPETGWTLDYAPVDRTVRRRGTHGFDNRDRDMHMIFYASGPSFRAGHRQPPFRNQNLYLILCRVLGIEPAPNDGRWRDVEGMFSD